MNKDSKLIEVSCKEHLMNVVKESKNLDKKLSFFQKTLLYDKIKDTIYDDALVLQGKNGFVATTKSKTAVTLVNKKLFTKKGQ